VYLPYEAYTGAAAAPLDQLLDLRLPRGCFVESALATLPPFGRLVWCSRLLLALEYSLVSIACTVHRVPRPFRSRLRVHLTLSRSVLRQGGCAGRPRCVRLRCMR
jgi:hypothetical protein